MLVDFFLFFLSLFLNNGKSPRPSKAAFFKLPLNDLIWTLLFIIIHQLFLKNTWKFSICSSFGRQLNQKWGRAGSEHYLRTHIIEPPCFCTYLFYINFSLNKLAVSVNKIVVKALVYEINVISKSLVLYKLACG